MIPSNILKINILYSNYPNPIVIERIKKLKENNVNVKVTFANRKGNINKLNFDKSICDHQIINSKQLKKFNLNRWFLVIKFFNVINKDDYDVYPIYPDMLLSAFIFKLFNWKKKIFYEIQDLTSCNIVFKILHNILMLFVNKIFITSNHFRIEFLPIFKKFLEPKTLFISNAPTFENHKKLVFGYSKKKENSDKKAIGFIGNLRDIEHINQIDYILKNTNHYIIQAGSCDFNIQLNALKKIFPNRLSIYGKFNYESLNLIYSRICWTWCVYPNTYNYKYHIARRLHESIILDIPVIIAEHAIAMIDICNKFNHPYTLFRKNSFTLKDLSKNSSSTKTYDSYDFHIKKQIFLMND